MDTPLKEKGNGGNAPDFTGRERMIRNILSSWGGHMVFVVAGFVMPRMIDRHVGQVSLGIWDFSWSLVSYFGLASLGVGSSVNRYVAKLRAEGNREGLDEAVSSVVCVQVVVAAVVGLMTVAAVWFLPHFFKKIQGANLYELRWVIALLGASLAVQQMFDAFRGVMTGCHRWDLHNAISAISYGITVILMILVLSMGHGLRSMAAVYLATGIATEIYRYLAVRRICPELDLRYEKATWKQGKEMLSFGIKTVVVWLPPLIIIQGSSLLIARYLGPALLAVFSRPMGLIRSGQTFINKYALVLTPTAGSLQGAGLQGEIQDLVIRTTRYSVALTLPMVLFLSILGDPIMQVWMGPRYDAGRIMAILAVGSFLLMSQQSVITILVGLNLHGPIGLVKIALSIVTMGIGVLALGVTGWSLAGAAILVSVYTTANGIAILLYACRKFDIPFGRYFRKSFLGPMAAGVPYGVALLVVNVTCRRTPLIALGAGCTVSLLVLGPIYWKYFFPAEIRGIFHRIPGFSGLAKAIGID